MSKKPLIILLVIIILAMSFLIWFKNSEDINGNLNSNIPVLDDSNETTSPEFTGGIDINLSDDESFETEKETSGEIGTSGDSLTESGEKESTLVNQPIIPEKENNTLSNQETESGELLQAEK